MLGKGTAVDEASIGGVIAVRRRCGLGSRILAAVIEVARSKCSAERIVVEAQTYARKLYVKAGFIQASEVFLADGIAHILMIWEP